MIDGKNYLAQKTKQIRIANCLTREELAWRLGTVKSAVAMWEYGLTQPSPKQCSIIADMGGISIEELFGSTKNEDNDMVYHPDHYTWKKKECREIQRDMVDGLSGMAASNMCNIIKYLYRVGHKDDIKQDLDKAKQFIDFLYEDLQRENNQEEVNNGN